MPKCKFCTKDALHARSVKDTMIDLCQEHYEKKTLGELTEYLRKPKPKEEPTKLKKDGYPFNKLKRKK